MRHTGTIAILAAALAASTCTKNTSNAPTSTTTTTSVVTTTTSTTSVATTTIPATFIVSGRVTSEQTGAALGFADIEIREGANIGRRFQGSGDGTYTMPGLNPGTFVARYWAPGYLTKDVTVTVTTSNLTVDVQLTPVPVTTTTVPSLSANFTFSPNPCTFSPGPTINCTVDSSSSTGEIATRKWLYAGKEVVDQVTHALSFGCGDLVGSGTNRTISVRLNVFDAAGNLSTTDSGVPVNIVGGACP